MRQSSASSFAARLVEPTRSQNITVIGRRSAVIDGAGLVGGAICVRRGLELAGDRLKQALSVPEEYAKLFEVTVGQFRQDFRVDLVVAKCGLVLAESEAS